MCLFENAVLLKNKENCLTGEFHVLHNIHHFSHCRTLLNESLSVRAPTSFQPFLDIRHQSAAIAFPASRLFLWTDRQSFA